MLFLLRFPKLSEPNSLRTSYSMNEMTLSTSLVCLFKGTRWRYIRQGSLVCFEFICGNAYSFLYIRRSGWYAYRYGSQWTEASDSQHLLQVVRASYLVPSYCDSCNSIHKFLSVNNLLERLVRSSFLRFVYRCFARNLCPSSKHFPPVAICRWWWEPISPKLITIVGYLFCSSIILDETVHGTGKILEFHPWNYYDILFARVRISYHTLWSSGGAISRNEQYLQVVKVLNVLQVMCNSHGATLQEISVKIISIAYSLLTLCHLLESSAISPALNMC